MASMDMSLDDVIKKTGGRGGRSGAKKGAGAKEAAPASSEKKTERRTGLSAAAKSALGAAGGKSKGPLGTLSAAFKGLGLPVRTLGVKPVDRPADGSAKNTSAKERVAPGKNRRAAKQLAAAATGNAPKGTEDKLSMSLEDMIKFQVKRGKKPEKEKANGAATAAGGAEGGGPRARGGRRRGGMMKLRKEAPAPKAKGEGKGKAKSNARGRGNVEWGKGGGKGKEESWGGKGGGGGGMRGWTGGLGKRSRAEDYDDWGPPPARRARTAGGADFGWGGKGEGRWVEDRWGPGDYSWGGGSGSKGRGRDDPGWSRDWDDRDRLPVRERERERPRVPPAPLDRVPAKAVRDAGPPRAQRDAGRRPGAQATVRVSNVPRNLDWRDIKDAFQDIGRVVECEVERGVAYVIFDNAVDAKKAVQTFDRGELNGQTIFVTHEK